MKMCALGVTMLLVLGCVVASEPPPARGDAADVMTMVQDARCKQIVVTCLINNQPMRMMLDTGASHTVLHTESAAGLRGVQWVDTSAMPFRGNSRQRPGMLMAPLHVGPSTVSRHLFMVLDLSAARGAMAEQIDGILGMDVLGGLSFTFDQREGKFHWGIPEGVQAVPLRGKQDKFGRLIVEAKCQDKPLELLLDTGSSVTRVRAEDWAPGAGQEIEVQVGDVDEAARISIMQGAVADLEVAAEMELKGVTPIFGREGEPPVLGMDALRGAALIHLPAGSSPHGGFFLQK